MDRLSFLKRFTTAIATVVVAPNIVFSKDEHNPTVKREVGQTAATNNVNGFIQTNEDIIGFSLESLSLVGSKRAEVPLFNNSLFENKMTDNGGGEGSLVVNYFNQSEFKNHFTSEYFDVTCSDFGSTQMLVCNTDSFGNKISKHYNLSYFRSPYDFNRDRVRADIKHVFDFSTQILVTINPGEKIFFYIKKQKT